MSSIASKTTRMIFQNLLLTFLLITTTAIPLPLHDFTLQTIQSSTTPIYIRIDPINCDLKCKSLDGIWSQLAEQFPSRVYILNCDNYPKICIQLGANFNVDVYGSLIEAWTGYSYERFTGKKDIPNLFKWIRTVEDGTLVQQLLQPKRDLSVLKTLPSIPVWKAEAVPKIFQQQLLKQGVLHLSNVIKNEKLTKALFKYINETLLSAIQKVESDEYNETQLFGRVLARKHRFDVKLPLENILNAVTPKASSIDSIQESTETKTRTALQLLLNTVRPILSPLLSSNVTKGDDSELFDLSAVVSDPGSAEQTLHFDQAHTADPSVYSIFVALQDLTVDMGPTVYVPFSHRKEGIGTKEQNNLLQPQVGLMKRGDVVIFDGRIFHQGTANTSKKRRTLFYVSFKSNFKNSQVSSTSSNHNAGSLLSEIAEKRYTMGRLCKRLNGRRREGGWESSGEL